MRPESLGSHVPVTFTFVLTENKVSVIITFSSSALFNHSVLFYGEYLKEQVKKSQHPSRQPARF